MKKWAILMLIMLFGIAFGVSDMSDVQTGEGGYKTTAAPNQLRPISQDLTILKAAEALEDTAHPVFNEFLGGDVLELGTTYYDMQHNTTLGRNIALDDNGGAHIAWMYANNPLISSRNIKYNYVPEGAAEPQFPDGIRCDNAIYKSGYCTIDAKGCTPYVVYHQANSATADYHSQISWDAASIETECMIHGGFSPADPAPPTIPLPECPDARPDIVDIWPVISISDIDMDVHMIATTSNNDTVLCEGERIAPPNYMGYYHGHVDIDDGSLVSSIDFDEEGLALAESRGISGEIATARTRDEVAVAYMYMGEYECNWPDSNNIFLLRSSDDGATWDTTNVTNNGPNYREEALDTHYYAGLYILDIDSSGTPYDTTIGYYVDTTVIYSRPSGGLTCFYDEEDYVHIMWTEGSYVANDSCTGNTVSAYYRSNIFHWSDRNPGEITTPLSSYPSLTPTPGGDAEHPRYFYSSYAPNGSVNLDDGTLYCIWQQYYGEIWWLRYMPSWDTTSTVYYDRSSAEWANQEIFMSYSDDHGQTWKGPLPLSNTYSPFCESGDCLSELDPTIAKVTDDYVHIAYIEDHDAGLSIQEEGEFVECPVKYAKISTDRVKAAADAIDMIAYLVTNTYPDTLIEGGLDSTDFSGLLPGTIHPDYFDGVQELKRIDKPADFELSANFPNPFNARTMITFDIEHADNYILEVYDMSGKLVSILANSYMSNGKYSVKWEGTDLLGNPLESGTYLYRLRDSKGKAVVRKMSLIK